MKHVVLKRIVYSAPQHDRKRLNQIIKYFKPIKIMPSLVQSYFSDQNSQIRFL